jgi:hypothetical protein
MSDEADCTRRWLINTSGAAILSSAIPLAAACAQAAAAPAPRAGANAADDQTPISPAMTTLADYVAKALDRELPAEVVVRTKLHVLDTFAAIVSGSRLKAGELAARYVDSLGGKPQAMVIGTGILTSTVNAALANAMAAHADETDDTNPIGPVHLGCSAVPAALATAEPAGRSGRDLLRAVTLGYDVGARMVSALGVGQGPRRRSPSVLTSSPPQPPRRCCASTRARCVIRSPTRRSRPPASGSGRAITNMSRRHSISGAWARATA